MGPLKAKANAPGELEILRSESALAAFIEALARDAGQHWDGALRDAGFEVWQAV